MLTDFELITNHQANLSKCLHLYINSSGIFVINTAGTMIVPIRRDVFRWNELLHTLVLPAPVVNHPDDVNSEDSWCVLSDDESVVRSH